MNSEKTSSKIWERKIRKIAEKKWCQRKLISKEETITSGLKETSKEEVSSYQAPVRH